MQDERNNSIFMLMGMIQEERDCRQEGGEEIAVGQERNYLILSELYLHLIFFSLFFNPLVSFSFLFSS